MKYLPVFFIQMCVLIFISFQNNEQQPDPSPYIIILGTVQDGGSPHIGCTKECCRALFENPDPGRKVVSLGLVDPANKKNFIFEATPDFPVQVKALKRKSSLEEAEMPDGIFLTHAHIGHYTGLMYLGKEAMNTRDLPVFAMPQMKTFLENNGPWNQLINLRNIAVKEMVNEKAVPVTTNLSVIPFAVPHRDEYSETVGFKIIGPKKSALFIPDIDKWSRWDKDIVNEIAKVDYAFIDATFYDTDEINNRDISEIPHPFIIESMSLFDNLDGEQKNKICFIHLNHTNPVLNQDSRQSLLVASKGYNIARVFDVFEL